MFDLKTIPVPIYSLVHLENLVVTYRLNSLEKNNPPTYDPDIATQSQILLEELNFQNRYNVSTGHAVRIDLFSRDLSNENWNLETSKLIDRTGLHLTNQDILYPYLTNANVWLCNPTTELGVQLTVPNNFTWRDDDYLMIKSGLVVKSDSNPSILYNEPIVINLIANTSQTILDEGSMRTAISVHTPTTNTSSVFLKFGSSATLSSYHLELPPGYNNPLFQVNTNQLVSVISPSNSALVIG